MPSGDLYQLRALIKVPEGIDMNFDVNIVSGWDGTQPLQGAYGGQNYAFEVFTNAAGGPWNTDLDSRKTGYTVFSTFSDPVKWNPQLQLPISGNAQDPIFLSTGDWFRLPNLPNEFDGMRVQIGPGADNLNYNDAGLDEKAYPDKYNNLTGSHTINSPIEFSTSSWFGTGAPWSPQYFGNLWNQARGG